MLLRGKRLTTGIVVFTLLAVVGTGTAWGKPSGIVKPFVTGTGGGVGTLPWTHASASAFGATLIGPGSPSPYCDPYNNSCVPPLLYGGAPVMHEVTTHVIAWDPSSAFPIGYVSGFQTFLGDVASALGASQNISSVAAQYVDGGGPALSSLTNATVITDTTAYPTSGCSVSGASACLTEAQILSEVISKITSGGLPVNLNQSYIVLLPPGVDSCFDSSASDGCEGSAFCGYHDLFTVDSAHATFTLLPYTNTQYSNATGACVDGNVTYPGNDPSTTPLYALDSVGAHELMESATDPTVGATGIGFGYVDPNQWEIGDECSYWYGTTNAATGGGQYNQLINGHQYLIQEMWSDQDNNCVQGDATTATASVTPGASPSRFSATSFTTALSHDGTATATNYAWSYTDPNGTLHHDIASVSAPQLNLAVGGPNVVWVQITDSAGGTVTGAANVDVLGTPPTASFGYSTSGTAAATHETINFASTSSADSTENITAASWDFGDGVTASGSSTSHAYASAGKYTVTLTVTETDGQTARTSQVVTVDDPPTAAFSWSSNPTASTAMSFSSSGTAAGVGSIIGYSWNFGDGTQSSVADPSHSYASSGSYTVALTVTQSDGLTASVSHTITVAAAPSTGSGAGGSGGGSPTGSGSPSGAGSGGPAQATPSPATVGASLTPALKPTSVPTIVKLLRTGKTILVLPSPVIAGNVTISWYATVKHHKILVARGSANVTAGTAAHVAVTLTAAGRRLLHKSRTLRITVVGVYRYGSSGVSVIKEFTLRA